MLVRKIRKALIKCNFHDDTHNAHWDAMSRLKLDTSELRPYKPLADKSLDVKTRVRYHVIDDYWKLGEIRPDSFADAIFGPRAGLLERQAKVEWEKITIAKRAQVAREYEELQDDIRTFWSLSQKFGNREAAHMMGHIRSYSEIPAMQKESAMIKRELNEAMRMSRMGKAAYTFLKDISKSLKPEMRATYLDALKKFARRASLPIPSYTEDINNVRTRYDSRW